MAFPASPNRLVTSPDGTRIAVFSAGSGPAVLLVHGTSADHRTWRVVAPELAGRRRVHALDRRGRGDSGDAAVYAIERELEDVAAVADALADEWRAGGRGRALAGRADRARGEPADGEHPAGRRVRERAGGPRGAAGSGPNRDEEALLDRLRADLAAGDMDGLLARFMTEAVGMPARSSRTSKPFAQIRSGPSGRRLRRDDDRP